jgi:hypothetical protein
MFCGERLHTAHLEQWSRGDPLINSRITGVAQKPVKMGNPRLIPTSCSLDHLSLFAALCRELPLLSSLANTYVTLNFCSWIFP